MIFKYRMPPQSRPVDHGGPDEGTPLRHDFSTNANPLPPHPAVLQALAQADRRHYPDPGYRALREQLGMALEVAPERLLPTAGSSEAIRRLSLAAAQRGRRSVWLPQPGYGDYRAAADSLGLPVHTYADAASLLAGLQRDGAAALVWLNEPLNPVGSSWPAADWLALAARAETQGAWLALDRAYEPLRLVGSDPVPPEVAAQCWQLLSPNKALGLTGVRAGLLLAPRHAGPAVSASVEGLAPSWVLSAEGVALLQVAHSAEVQDALADARSQLRAWQALQRVALDGLGWTQRDSVTPFWLARPEVPAAALPQRLQALRAAGIKLRDARSFGLPGWVRVSTQSPEAQQALVAAWQGLSPRRSPGAWLRSLQP
jgi:histidinol-phosphate aminotransferase